MRNCNKISCKSRSKQGPEWGILSSDGWAFNFEEASKTTWTFVVFLYFGTTGYEVNNRQVIYYKG